MPLDFPGGAKVIITRDLRRGRPDEQSLEGDEPIEQSPRETRRKLGKGLQAQECGRLQKPEKNQGNIVSLLGFQERSLVDAFILAQGEPVGLLTFRSLGYGGCGKPPSVW